ncbi:unnamed protein product [Mytilus coruscus]|uniref:Uncharacterized protein n=1 Tax=Mytilus coruscus TaxID=42192 RepID=A0A6J8C6C3_MYTCO|nr:unnamed protein product [Mytilus coruscus]
MFDGPYIVNNIPSSHLIKLRDPTGKRKLSDPVHINRLKIAHIRAPDPAHCLAPLHVESTESEENETLSSDKNDDIEKQPSDTIDSEAHVRRSTRKVNKPMRFRDENFVTSNDIESSTDAKSEKVKRILAKKKNGNQSFLYLVQLVDPPENKPIIRQVKPGPVDSGDTVYLHCSVYGGYPIANISWDCQGKIKDQSSDTLSAVILELVVDRRYDDKICSCSATHLDPSYKHTIQHKLTVYFSPSIPKLSTIPEKPWFVGNTTNVLCLSEEGKPKSEFQWSVNGQLKMENNSVLPIGPLTKNDDNIEVFCNVMNEYTTRHEITLTSEPLHLDVEYNPEVRFDNNVHELYAIEGENVTVKCWAYGNPKAMVHWEASNIELTVPEDGQSVLYIYRIERHQHFFTCHAVSLSTKYGQLVTSKPIEIEVFSNCLDTGIYQCKAVSNIQGKLYSSTAQTNLNVICGPRTDYRYPSIPSKIAVALNDSFELTVRLVAFPSPLLNWYLLDTKLNFSTYVLGSSVSTNIYVPKVQKTNLGRYTLNAINNAGSHIININVVKKGKPDLPSVLHSFCGSTTANIVWTVPFDGGDRQKFQVHYWADDNGAQINKSKYLDDPGEGKSLEYETKGLREKTVYYFQIIASNSLGYSTTTVQCNTTLTYKQSSKTESSPMTTSVIAIIAVGSVICILLTIFLVCYCRNNKCCPFTKTFKVCMFTCTLCNLTFRSSQQMSNSNTTYMSQDNVVASSVTLTGDPTSNPDSETDQSDGYIVPVDDQTSNPDR